MGAIDGALRLTRAAVSLAGDVARVGGRTVETAVSTAAGSVARRVGLQAADSAVFSVLRGEGSVAVRLFERVGEMTGANAGTKAAQAALTSRLTALETAHVAAQGEIGSLRTANTALSERLARTVEANETLVERWSTAAVGNTALQGEVASLRTANAELASKLSVATAPRPLRNGLVQLTPGQPLPPSYNELRSRLGQLEVTHSATLGELQTLRQEHAALQAAQPTGVRGLFRKITG